MAKAEKISTKLTDKELSMLDAKCVEYMGLKEADKENAKIEATIKEDVVSYIQKHGEETESGHLVLETEMHELIYEKRSTVSVNADAGMRILAKKNLLERATTLVIDHTKLGQLFLDGELTEKDMDKIVGEKVSWAFKLKRKA